MFSILSLNNFSELIAAESVACLNKALCQLKDIWEEIGIAEDQRLERTNVVKNHVKVSVLEQHLMNPKKECFQG